MESNANGPPEDDILFSMATLIAYNVDHRRSDPKVASRFPFVKRLVYSQPITPVCQGKVGEAVLSGLVSSDSYRSLTSSGSWPQDPAHKAPRQKTFRYPYRTIRCTLNSRLVKSSIRPSSPSIISLIACSRRASTGGFVLVDVDLGFVGAGVIGSVVVPLTAVLRNVTR
jgi:hypothetical protein